MLGDMTSRLGQRQEIFETMMGPCGDADDPEPELPHIETLRTLHVTPTVLLG